MQVTQGDDQVLSATFDKLGDFVRQWPSTKNCPDARPNAVVALRSVTPVQIIDLDQSGAQATINQIRYPFLESG
jgi:hypothetical protein